jgi:hypothetical protein
VGVVQKPALYGTFSTRGLGRATVFNSQDWPRLLDLSFARTVDRPVAALPTQLAVLLVGVATRQAASFTARVQSRIALRQDDARLLAPASGAFHAAAAALLTREQGE